MNKRLPLILSLVGMILLAVSLAYWILQLYQPPQRPLAAVPRAALPEPPIEAAASLFGGQVAVASATNYQLTGIVAAGRDSVAIIVADGTPPKALKVGKELSPGITLAEVHPRYVMLSDGGVMKRIDLAADAKAAAPMGGSANGGAGNAGAANVQMMAPGPQAPAGNTVSGQTLASPVPEGALPPSENTPEPPMSPGAVSQQMPGSNQMGSSGQAPAQNSVQPPTQMAPPVQTSASPGGRVPQNQ